MLGVVTGLAAESGCLEALAAAGCLRVRCAGTRPDAALAAARELLAAGCCGLISFGLAGGLAPGLAPGTLVVARAVITADGTHWPVAGAWHHRLVTALAGESEPITGPIAGVDRPVATPEAKRALGRTTGAVACDMESHKVAEAAAAAGVPFVVCRAIADDWSHAVPGWLDRSIARDGRPRVGFVVAGLCRRPGDLPALLRLAGGSRRGLAALRRLAARVGPGFRFEIGL